MALDTFARFVAEACRRAPLLFRFTTNVAPLLTVESIYLVEPFDGCEVKDQRPDRIGLLVVDMIMLRHRQALDRLQNGGAHPVQHRNESYQFFALTPPPLDGYPLVRPESKIPVKKTK